jgi:dienelactone hydrolase
MFLAAASAASSRETEVTFPSANLTLAGTLLQPAAAGPHPAIILLHGSGPGPRSFLRPFAERFVRLGFAALIYDKRGAGGSGGSWTSASLDDLADDARAAATFLKSRPDIDGNRIGLWGVSQAGWVIPRTVAKAPGTFSLAIIVTGGGVRPIEVERLDYAAALDRIGATPDQRREALALVER